MSVPDNLKIFSLIYEYRAWVLIPLTFLWLMGFVYFLFWVKKVFFLWILILSLFIQPLHIATIWCGWHYRMELYDQFAKTPYGWHDIDYMPTTIRDEYAKHNYHPRFCDMRAMAVGTIIITPILYIFGGLVFIILFLIKYWLNRRKKVEKEV